MSLSTYKSSLRENLATVKSAGADNANELLSTTSVPLLKSLLSDLKGQQNADFDSSVRPLVPLAVPYIAYPETRSLALLVIMQIDSMFGSEAADPAIVATVEDIVDTSETRSQRYKAIEIVSQLFPITRGACTELFLKNESFVSLLANEITFLLGCSEAQLVFDGASNLETMLDLFSNACIDDGCRKVIGKMYTSLLVKVLKMDSASDPKLEAQCIASTIVIKVYNTLTKETFEKEPDLLSPAHISEVLINGLIMDSTEKMIESSIEGLAFLSLNVSIKQQLRKDDNFVTALLEERHFKNKELVYGVLCIVRNMTTYTKVLNQRQQSVQHLKDYANMSNVDPRTGQKSVPQKEDDEQVAQFVGRLLVDKKILEKIALALKTSNSRGVTSQALPTLWNLSTRPSHRQQVVKHGGLNIVLSYLASASDGIRYLPDVFVELSSPVYDPETRIYAIKTLARILMSADPTKLFPTPKEMINPVPFLLEEVVQFDIDVNGTKLVTPLATLGDDAVSPSDCFESLIALVNLSSVDSMQIRDVITKLAWDSISNLMYTANYQIQRADLELVSNLILSPLCSAKFFNWQAETDPNYENFARLCQMMSLQDEGSQKAVLNIFANCSDYGLISKMLAQSPLFLKKLFETMNDMPDDDDIQLRCIYILVNVLAADPSIKEDVMSQAGETIAKDTNSTSPELKQMAQQLN